MVGHQDRMDLSLLMSQAVRHRGPDGQKNWNNRQCYLGFRHLAFVGDDQSLQPFHNETDDIHVVCNGEIYNHKILRKELKSKGHEFTTQSDCEVIVHLYEEYDEYSCKKLQGQFAFILWDAKKNRLVAARDRFGICPLFFAKLTDRIILGSEIKAVLTDSSVQATLDLKGIAQTVLLYGPAPPRTCFRNVYQVPPGSYIVMDAGNWKITNKIYWSINLRQDNNETREQIQHTFGSLFKNAITRRIHGNFSPAVLASGGLDSSVVASVLASLLGKVDLFSLQFDTPIINESVYQRLLAKHIGATFHPLHVQTKDIFNNILKCVWHCESPLIRLAPVPMMLLYEHVRKSGFKCVLSGEGADELLAGYPIFFKNEASIEQKYVTAQKILKLLRDTSVRRAIHKTYQSLIIYSVDEKKSRLQQSQEIEIKTKLSQYLLASQGDRVALANGMEQRFPFLDEPLVDYLSTLPSASILNGTSGKVLLKRVFGYAVPSQIVQRKKQGYVAPDSSFFDLKPNIQEFNMRYLSDQTIKSSGYFRVRSIRRLRQQVMSKEVYDNLLVQGSWFFAVTTQMLHTLFIDKDTSRLDHRRKP